MSDTLLNGESGCVLESDTVDINLFDVKSLELLESYEEG